METGNQIPPAAQTPPRAQHGERTPVVLWRWGKGGMEGVNLWYTGRYYIYIYASPPPPKTNILTPWQMFMCQSIVFHVDHHLTSSVHIIPFSFKKKPSFTERLLVHIEDSSLQATSLFEKVRSSKKEGYFALKKVRSSIERNIFSVCINWTFLSSPFFEEQFILYHS